MPDGLTQEQTIEELANTIRDLRAQLEAKDLELVAVGLERDEAVAELLGSRDASSSQAAAISAAQRDLAAASQEAARWQSAYQQEHQVVVTLQRLISDSHARERLIRSKQAILELKIEAAIPSKVAEL